MLRNIGGRIMAKKLTAKERYLRMVFTLIKKRDNLIISDKSNRFNDTELRLISEVLLEKSKGNRLISTQLAKRLGVTRSAVSQIVNRLEAEGIVKRVPDDVDRKIAYVEITDESLKAYEKDIKACTNFVGETVERYGAEKFEQMCAMVEEFIDCMNEMKEKYGK